MFLRWIFKKRFIYKWNYQNIIFIVDVGSLSEDEMIAQEVHEILNIMVGVVNSSLEAEEKEKQENNKPNSN